MNSSTITPVHASHESRRENLALLYQGVLTAIVRVQAGRQPINDATGFRKRMEDVLDQIANEAVRTGYDSPDVADANYAVVAFLDEVVLNSKDPSRTQWHSIHADMYGKAVAGEGFFERLKSVRTRRDSASTADVMEVYYLCLLLGYRGRYALAGEAEFARIMDELSEKIRSVRSSKDTLSPTAVPVRTGQPAAPTRASIGPAIWILVAIAVSLLIWIVFKVLLYVQAHDVADFIGRTLAS